MGSRRRAWVAAAGIGALVVAWIVGEALIQRTNPPQRHVGVILSPDADPLLKRACFDCHSNETRYPWYSYLPLASLRIALHVVDPVALRPVAMTLHILAAVRKLWPGDFAWLPPPYEYEHEKMPIDILYGASRLRETLASDSLASPQTISELACVNEAAWWRRARPFLLYT